MTSCPLAASREAGSSARMAEASATIARAIGTRCGQHLLGLRHCFEPVLATHVERAARRRLRLPLLAEVPMQIGW
jgi:hypothetical protein